MVILSAFYWGIMGALGACLACLVTIFFGSFLLLVHNSGELGTAAKSTVETENSDNSPIVGLFDILGTFVAATSTAKWIKARALQRQKGLLLLA